MIPVKRLSKDVYLVNGIKTVIIDGKYYSTNSLNNHEIEALDDFITNKKIGKYEALNEVETGNSQSTIHRDGIKEIKN